MKASPEAKPRAVAEETLEGAQRLVWQPPPLRIDREFLRKLDALLMESCRDTVDAVVIAYKRDHERELSAPGGSDQLLAFYSECKEKIIPHYMLEIRHGSAHSFSGELNLAGVLAALDSIPRGNILSMQVTTRGARVSTSLYLGSRLPGQSQITVAGSNALVSTRMMKSLVELIGKWGIRAGFIHTRLFAVLFTGALQSIYLITLFQLLASVRWLPVLGMLGVGMWAAMAASFSLAFPPLVFQLGKTPDRTRRRWLGLFLLLNLLFLLAIAAAILFPL